MGLGTLRGWYRGGTVGHCSMLSQCACLDRAPIVVCMGLRERLCTPRATELPCGRFGVPLPSPARASLPREGRSPCACTACTAFPKGYSKKRVSEQRHTPAKREAHWPRSIQSPNLCSSDGGTEPANPHHSLSALAVGAGGTQTNVV